MLSNQSTNKLKNVCLIVCPFWLREGEHSCSISIEFLNILFSVGSKAFRSRQEWRWRRVKGVEWGGGGGGAGGGGGVFWAVRGESVVFISIAFCQIFVLFPPQGNLDQPEIAWAVLVLRPVIWALLTCVHALLENFAQRVGHVCVCVCVCVCACETASILHYYVQYCRKVSIPAKKRQNITRIDHTVYKSSKIPVVNQLIIWMDRQD